MGYQGKDSIIEIIDRKKEYRNTLAVSDFSHVFDNMVTCYKLYWLEAIIELLLKNDRTIYSLAEIIAVMISNAWYTVREYHLNMGTVYRSTDRKNGIEAAVNDLAAISGLENNATKEQILEKLRAFDSDEKLLKDKEKLMTEVPFHFLSPFFDSTRRKELRKWNFDRSVKEISIRNSEVELPYHFVRDNLENTCIEIGLNWCQLFIDNNAAILDWIKYEKIQYLQKRNSTVSEELIIESIDRPVSQRNWVREEVCLLVAEYFRTKGSSADDKEKTQEFVSKVLRSREKKISNAEISDTFRNTDEIKMQFLAIRGIDPDAPHKSTVSTMLQKRVFQEYLDNPATIKAEAYDVIRKYYL